MAPKPAQQSKQRQIRSSKKVERRSHADDYALQRHYSNRVSQQLLSLKCPWVKLDTPKDATPSKPVGTDFGYTSRPQYRDLYCGMRNGGGTGSVTTHAELGLVVTDFFDYNVVPASGSAPLPVTNYFWNVDQNLFENSALAPILDNELTFCRVRKITVHVLPAKGFEIGSGSGPNTNNAQGMFTVQAQVPAVSGTQATSALATNTQVTNVLPQIDTFWKKVLTCDYDQTFKSGVARPYFDATGVQASAQCLFQMAVVDPTDGLPYLNNTDDNLVIRVKVSIHVDQPISVIQRASLRVFKNDSFATPSTVGSSGDPFAETSAEYVQTDLRRVLNNFR